MTNLVIKFVYFLFFLNSFNVVILAEEQVSNNQDCQGRECFEDQIGVSIDFSYVDEQNKKFFETYAPLLDEDSRNQRLLGYWASDRGFKNMRLDSVLASLCGGSSEVPFHRLNNEISSELYIFCGSKLIRIRLPEMSLFSEAKALSNPKNVLFDLRDVLPDEPLERLKAERFHCNLSENRCFFEMPYLESGNEIYEFDPLTERVYQSREFVATQEDDNGAYSNDFTYLGNGIMIVSQGSHDFFFWNKNEPFSQIKILNYLNEKSTFLNNLIDPDNGAPLVVRDNFTLNDPATGQAYAIISAIENGHKWRFESRFIVMNASGSYTFLPNYATNIHGIFENQVIFSGTGAGTLLSLDSKEFLSVNLYSMDFLSGTIDVITEEKLHNIVGLKSDRAYFFNGLYDYYDLHNNVIVGKAGVFYEITVDGMPQIVLSKRTSTGNISSWQNILLQDLWEKTSVLNANGIYYSLPSFLPLTTDAIIADISGPYFFGSIIAHTSKGSNTLYDKIDFSLMPRDFAPINEKLKQTVYRTTSVLNKNFEINGEKKDHLFDIHFFMNKETDEKFKLAREKGVNAHIPTILYIYGGNGKKAMDDATRISSMYPWIEKGGAIVFAGIAGGEDSGVSGYLSGIASNRMNAINDIEAIAQVLSLTIGFTSYQHLGFLGGSHGGFVGGLTYLLKKNICKAYSLLAGYYDLSKIKSPSWEINYGKFLTQKIEMEAWSLMDKVGPNVSSVVLLQHSLWDTVVPYQQSYNFAKKVADLNGKVFLLTYEMAKMENDAKAGHNIFSEPSELDFFMKELMPQ